MLFPFLLSPPLLAQHITDTGWKVINKDVYKKDTSGKVVIGNTETKEKLNIGGNLRIDGLKGPGYRDVIVDKEGKLHPGRQYEIPPEWTGEPDDVNIPDILWRPNPDPGGWNHDPTDTWPDNRPFCGWSILSKDFLTTLCPVGIGIEAPQSILHLKGQYPTITISNIFVDGSPNEPAIIFDNDGEMGDTPTTIWKIGAQVSGGSEYFRINFENYYDKELFRITREGKVGIGTDNPQAELEISSPGFYYANTLPIIRNTGNGGAGFRFIPGGNAKEWFIHATGPANSQGANKLVFKTIDTTTAMTLTTLGGVKAEIFGDLNVTGNFTSSSPLGINFTGNLVTTGYLKSGNSIIIAGGVGGGVTGNQDNIIYSSDGLISFMQGDPALNQKTGDIRVGIGVTPTFKGAKFTIKGNLAFHEYYTHFKIINNFDEDILSINEFPSETMLDKTVTEINIGKTNDSHGSSTINLYGDTEIHSGLTHLCFDPIGCGARFNGGIVSSGLHVRASSASSSGHADLLLASNDGANWAFVVKRYTDECGTLNIYNPVTDRYSFIMNQNGDLGLLENLTVGKNIFLKTFTACDFVFGVDYRLKSLYEVEEYIKENGHLSDFAPAAEMEKNGVDLNEMNSKLLKNIEEHTLYLIELKKEVDKMRGEMEEMRGRVGEMGMKIKTLKN